MKRMQATSLQLNRRPHWPNINQLDLDSAHALADNLAGPTVKSAKEPARERHPADGAVTVKIERRRPARRRRILREERIGLLLQSDQVGRLLRPAGLAFVFWRHIEESQRTSDFCRQAKQTARESASGQRAVIDESSLNVNTHVSGHRG